MLILAAKLKSCAQQHDLHLGAYEVEQSPSVRVQSSGDGSLSRNHAGEGAQEFLDI